MLLPWWAICPHVHCRDEEEDRKATIASVLELAQTQGIDMVFDMPNPKRSVTSRQRVLERLALVPSGEEDHYRLYVGLTAEESQIIEATRCYEEFPDVIGLKMFAGKSVGALSVIEPDDQRTIYQILSWREFRGVVALHCEKEMLMHPELWNPANPISHTLARPMAAEVESVRDQIQFATEAGFTGRIHICHVSCPESVLLVQAARAAGLRISCGVTPHHLMWDESMMNRPDGLLYKMNPSLRSRERVLELQKQLCVGMIDWIETDHAPHTAEEKAAPLCLSGYPSLVLYGQFVTEFLPNLGLTQSAIKALTRDNILEVFSGKL